MSFSVCFLWACEFRCLRVGRGVVYCGSMFKEKFTLFTAFGIPVRADLSVLVLLGYLVFVTRSPLDGLMAGGLLLVSIVIHEFAHSLVAMAFGGRVRDITLQVMGGCAAITQMPLKPLHELLMALAGPMASFILVGLGYGAMMLTLHDVGDPEWVGGRWVQYQDPALWAIYLTGMNLMLGIFNLVPAFPMDGGRVLRAGLQLAGKGKVAATYVARTVARGIAIFWVVMSVLSLLKLLPEPPEGLPLVVSFLWSIFVRGDLILILIAFMVYQSSEREYQMVKRNYYY